MAAKIKLSKAQLEALENLERAESLWMSQAQLIRTYKSLVKRGYAVEISKNEYEISDDGRDYLAELDGMIDGAKDETPATAEVSVKLSKAQEKAMDSAKSIRDMRRSYNNVKPVQLLAKQGGFGHATKVTLDALVKIGYLRYAGVAGLKDSRHTYEVTEAGWAYIDGAKVETPDPTPDGDEQAVMDAAVVTETPKYTTHFERIQRAIELKKGTSGERRGRIEAAIERMRGYYMTKFSLQSDLFVLSEPPFSADDTETMPSLSDLDSAIFEEVHSEYQSRKLVLNRGAKIVVSQSGVFVWRARRGSSDKQSGLWRYYPTYDESTPVDRFVQRYPSQFETGAATMDFVGQTVTAVYSSMYTFTGAIMRHYLVWTPEAAAERLAA